MKILLAVTCVAAVLVVLGCCKISGALSREEEQPSGHRDEDAGGRAEEP